MLLVVASAARPGAARSAAQYGQRTVIRGHTVLPRSCRSRPLAYPRSCPLPKSLPTPGSRQAAALLQVRSATSAPVPRGRIRRLFVNIIKALGTTTLVLGLGVAGFFLYDASTYREDPHDEEISVPTLALNPVRGGPKNLPIAQALIDDNDSEDFARQNGKPRLVILGSGWGAVAMLKSLNPDDYHVTVISPQNYFLFTPMLPCATVGTLSVRSLIEPIRSVIARVKGHYLQATAENVDFGAKLVEVSQTDPLGRRSSFYVPYDKLVIAVGSVSNTHGVKGLEHCYRLKDVADARKIRNAILANLEQACLPSTSDEERRRLLSFVISGGGPTGVEFAAELFDFLNEDLRNHFPKLLRNMISVHVIQSRGHILNTYDKQVSAYAEAHFARERINVLTNARVEEVHEDRIIFQQTTQDGTHIKKELPVGLCLWSTGVAQPEFCQRIAQQLGDAQTNKMALETDTYLRLNGTPPGDVYAIGDCSTVQNNIADHVVSFLRKLAWKHGRDPEKLRLSFSDWRSVAADVRRQFPQAISHLRRLDQLFDEYDKDRSGTLEFGELRELLAQIDRKLTSLPATAQRANQQGQYLAQKFNKIARDGPALLDSGVHQSLLDTAAFRAFEYKHLGNLAYIGNSAVFDAGEGWTISGGLWAVYAWRSVYFAQSVSFRTRFLMMMDWAKRGLFGRDFMNY